MINEKMRVLDMLDAGKITAEEATALLECLKGSTPPPFINRETRDNVEDRLRTFAQDCGKFAKDVGEKAQEWYKGVEPKLKKASQAALERAACALEDLACTINESMQKGECCMDDECCCEGPAETCGDEESRAN